jgi:dipeptidyl aminopeptidase/acylaminoacyl peptidase
MTADSNAILLDSGLLLFAVPHGPNAAMPFRAAIVTAAALYAQRIDPRTLGLTGSPAMLADNVRYNGNLLTAAFSASDNGVLAYRDVDPSPPIELAWLSRTGERLGAVLQGTVPSHPAISPDGTRVALNRMDAGTATPDIWIFDVLRSGRRRLTFDAATDMTPVWSPDGRRVAFASDRLGFSSLYVKNADGSGGDELLLKTDGNVLPTSWSPDGRYLAYQYYKGAGSSDLYALPLTGARTPIAISQAPLADAQAQFSPDGRWVAYASEDRDGYQIYVQPFPPTGARWQVSQDGGRQPFWRGDGRERYWIAADWRHLVAVDVSVAAQTLRAGAPHALFETRVWTGPPTPRNHFAVAADGQRFLVDTLAGERIPSPITVVLNWTTPVR